MNDRREKRSVNFDIADCKYDYCCDWKLLILLIVFRACNAMLCRTLYVPDEHWQSLEVAYHMVFQKGYLSWEWDKAIRGYTHPLLFAVIYKVFELTSLDFPWIVAESPRLLQGVISAIGDWYIYKISLAMFSSHHIAKYTLFCYLSSWFIFYCCTRTLSNTLECSLTPVILYYWLVAVTFDYHRYTIIYVLLACFSVLIRPTGLLLWVPLVCYQIIKTSKKDILLKQLVFIGLLSLSWSLIVDRLFYGRWVFVQFEFLKFNVFEAHSSQYGTHPWHWYFTQGLPPMLFTEALFVIHGIWIVIKSQQKLNCFSLGLAMWLVIIHSFIKHKEFRFVLPFLPLTTVYAGLSIFHLLMKKSKVINSAVYLLLASNIPLVLYFSLVHQRGGFVVMEELRKDVNANSSVLFLMPCHSTPFYSHLHGQQIMKFLECPPRGIYSTHKNKQEEFYNNPNHWLSLELYGHQLPTHIVFYDILFFDIYDFIHNNSYHKVTSIFHAHFLENDKVGHYILMYKQIIMPTKLMSQYFKQ